MRLNRISACVFAAAATVAGCMGTGDVDYAGEVRVTSPELIEISSGVLVVADADEPLFYSDGFYWLYRGGYWMRSDEYRGGFIRVELAYVPERVRTIERPQVYAQYRRHMGRNQQARATSLPRRTQQAPQPTYPTQVQPPAETTYVPNQTPRPQPPEPSPNDIHGTPMPPHHGGVGRDTVPPTPDRTPPGQDRDRTPPGQQNRAAPAPQPPQPQRPQVRDERGPQTPQERGPKARPEDRVEPNRVKQENQQDRDKPDRGNRGPGRSDEARDRKTDEKKDRKKGDK